MLSERELESRYEVFVEQYVTNLNIEAETAADMARTLLLPAALQYMALLDDAEEGAGVERLTKEIIGLTDEFVETIFALEEANAGHPETEDVLEAAKYVQATVIPAHGGRAARSPTGSSGSCRTRSGRCRSTRRSSSSSRPGRAPGCLELGAHHRTAIDFAG